MSKGERDSAKESVSAASAKHSKHHDGYDPKWNEEFTWLRYIHVHTSTMYLLMKRTGLLCFACSAESIT